MKNEKKAAGFWLAVITLVLSVAAIVAYFVNSKTAYFARYGTNTVVIACMIAAAVALVLYLLLNKTPVVGDLLAIAPPVLTVVALMSYVNDRVAGIASIMTFENNAANMADVTSAIVAIACMVLAMIVGIVSSFKAATK